MAHLAFSIIGKKAKAIFVKLLFEEPAFNAHAEYEHCLRLRRQFDCRRGLAEGRGPDIEMDEAAFLEHVVLEIPLHDVELGHGVTDRRAGGENDTKNEALMIRRKKQRVTALGAALSQH